MKRALLLEDDVALSFQITRHLRALGIEVETFRSAHLAQQAMLEARYDIVISDIVIYQDGKSVPDGGVLLTGWIRSQYDQPDLQKTPILCISGSGEHRGMANILKVASSVGADAVLAKPFGTRKLQDEVFALLGMGQP